MAAALELIREPDELDPVGTAVAASRTWSAADAGGVCRRSCGFLSPGAARRRAGIRSPRLLPVLARDRYSPSSVVAYGDRRRRGGIYRPGQGVADRLPGCNGDPGTGVSRLLPRGSRSRARQGVRQLSAV